MALERKMLEEMGIEKDKIEQIIKAHIDTVDALKNERDTYRKDAEKLPEIQKKLDETLKANSGNASYEVKYNALKEDFDKFKTEIAEKETKSAKEKALREMLNKIGVPEKRIDSIVKVTDLDNIKLNKDGKISDAENCEAGLKAEWADFIPTETEKKATPETPPTTAVGNTSMTKEQILEIKDAAERQKAIAENHELFNF